MNILTSSVAVDLFKDLLSQLSKKIPQAKDVLDKIKSDPQLELELKKLAQKQLELEIEREKIAQQDRASARELAKVDVMSDNFLSKNIRPITLLVILIILVIYAITGRELPTEMEGLFELVFLFYFGGRSIEKVAAMMAKGKMMPKG